MTTEAAALDTNLLARYAKEYRRKQRLTAALKVCGERMDGMEPQILSGLSQAQVDRVTSARLTFFVRREIWARAAEGKKTEAVELLKKKGYGGLVSETFNANTVSALIRELEADGAIPAEFKEVFTISELNKLGVRSA